MADDTKTTCCVCHLDTLNRLIVESGGFRIDGIGVYKPTSRWGILMEIRREKVVEFFSSYHDISVYYWVELLNLFETHKEVCNINDIVYIISECEKCRNQFNERNDDKIQKSDVVPNIYKYLDILKSYNNGI